MKNILYIAALGAIVAPIGVAISCGLSKKPFQKNIGFKQAENYKGNIFASQDADVDNLITLGYQPKYVNKSFDNQIMSSYFKRFVRSDYTELLNDRPAQNQTIDAEDFINKYIHAAFIVSDQTRLYRSLQNAKLPKENIGFATKGEIYVPDLDFLLSYPDKTNIEIIANEWNEGKYFNGYKARPSFEGTIEEPTYKQLKPKTNTANAKTFTFNRMINPVVSLEVTAESIDRITNSKQNISFANTIINAFQTRINNLKTLAKTEGKTALVLKPKYDSHDASDVIENDFAWSPNDLPFLYSNTTGLGYDMPLYKPGHGTISLNQDNQNVLTIDNAANVKEAFAGQVDDVFFLKPNGYTVDAAQIQADLQSMTKNESTHDVHIVDEEIYLQGNLGMTGYFTLMDQYANDFNVAGFAAKDDWGWETSIPETIKITL